MNLGTALRTLGESVRAFEHFNSRFASAGLARGGNSRGAALGSASDSGMDASVRRAWPARSASTALTRIG